MKFKKKVLEVEAIKISEVLDLITRNKFSKLPGWIIAQYVANRLMFTGTFVIVELSTCGQLRGGVDDWLVCGGKDDIYTCTPKEFERLYK